MNEEIKKEWVEALRSGKYKQGKSFLRTKDDKFCCIGVLEDIIIKREGMKWEEAEPGESGKDIYCTPEGMHCFASYSTIEKAGIKDPDFTVNYELGGIPFNSLYRLNDRGISFQTIANLIEEQL